ncbi:Hypothetical predicted protein, partial [Mytilus galloprovincialis]
MLINGFSTTREQFQVTVNVKLYVMALQGLDDKSQVLTSSVFWYFTWKDEIFKWDQSTEENKDTMIIMWRKTWILLQILLASFLKTFKIVMGGQEPVCYTNKSKCFKVRFLLVLDNDKCYLDVSKYPFDTQACSITMEAWYHDNKSFFLNTIGSGIEISDVHFVENGEWDILNLSALSFPVPGLFRQFIHFFMYTLYFNFEKTVFSTYLITTAFPFVILMAINLLVIVIPTECSEKLGFCMSQFLTMIVFLTLISQDMPSSSLTISYYTCIISLQILVSGITILIVAIIRIIFCPMTYFQDIY